jgi:hypothetical protein
VSDEYGELVDTNTGNPEPSEKTHMHFSHRSVGIATRYGLDGSGIKPGGGRDFRTRPEGPWGLPSLLYNGYRVFPGGKAAGAWC